MAKKRYEKPSGDVVSGELLNESTGTVEVDSSDSLKEAASQEPTLDKTDAKDIPAAEVLPSPTTVKGKVIDIINQDKSPLDKVAEVAKLIDPKAGAILNAYLGLHNELAVNAPADRVISFQKAVSRTFMDFLVLDRPVVKEQMKFITWAYRELTDPKLAAKYNMPLKSKMPLLEPMVAFMYTVTQDDLDIITFVLIHTIIDVKKDFPAKKIDTKKLDGSRLTEELYEKLNSHYVG